MGKAGVRKMLGFGRFWVLENAWFWMMLWYR